MPAIREMQGMRYPDDYVIRMFFKEGLHTRSGRVLELGCGSGNNLLLFQQFGWDVVGIDISPEFIRQARHNLSDQPGSATLIAADLGKGVPQLQGAFDAVILPSFNYYVPRASLEGIMVSVGRLLKPGGAFFLRSRTRQDWRYGRGREVEPHGFVLDTPVTGELGALNVFYEPDELTGMCVRHLGPLANRQVLRMRYDNPQNGVTVTNDEVVIWGRRS